MHRRIRFSSLLLVLGLVTLLASPSFSQETVIVLSDIVGGGDGSGTAPPENTGINPDTGVFETTNIFGNVPNTGDALHIVDDDVSEYIDSVFILTEATMPINSEEVTFDFLPSDTSPHTWDFILKDRTNDIDKGEERICAGSAGGQPNCTWSSGIGLHASAGITFDLEALRDRYGPEVVKFFSCFAGMDKCNGTISLYAIASDDVEILAVDSTQILGNNQGDSLVFEIPDDALYLTLAVGAQNGSIGCAHGVFAEPVISEAPPLRRLTSPSNPDSCPPSLGGPASGHIERQLRGGEVAATELVIVEELFGNFGVDNVDAPGATKEAIIDTTTVGFIQQWLLLGPYGKDGGAAPGEELIRMDYLTDGDEDELSILPRDGDQIETDFEIAASNDIQNTALNPDGIPTWNLHVDADTHINFNEIQGDLNEIMTYGVTYIRLAADVEDVVFGVASDDAVQVLLDDEEVHINNVARGVGGVNAVQDRAFVGVLEADRVYRIMVKIFEGGGGHGFRLRLETDNLDGTFSPLADGVEICSDPDGENCVEMSQGTPNGVKLTYETTLGEAETGFDYTVNIDEGTVDAKGLMGEELIQGDSAVRVLPLTLTIEDDLDIDGDGGADFEHAHHIGPGSACADTGVSTEGDGSISITGSGPDIWTNGDTFRYAYSEVTGDFSARVTITDSDFAPGSRWGKHGIMARENCNFKSRYAFIHDSGENREDNVRLAFRPNHLGAGNQEVSTAPPATHANTLRLDRVGNEFIAYAWDETGELSGVTCQWLEIGRYEWVSPDEGETPVPETIQVGLAVTSHTTDCSLTSIEFSDWQLTQDGVVSDPECKPPVQNLVCEAADGGGLDLSWDNDQNADAGQDIVISVNGEEKARVAGSETTASLTADDLSPGVNVICVRNFGGDNSPARCSAALPLPQGDSTILVEEDFDGLNAGDCPDGFACNGNNHTPGATGDGVFLGRDGRLNITAETTLNTAAGATLIDPIDLTQNSVEIELDVYMSEIDPNTPADGIVIAFVDADLHDENALGAAGGANAFHGGLNGFGVEVDIWNNGGEPTGANDATGPHIAAVRGSDPTGDHIQTMFDFDPLLAPGVLGGFVDPFGIGNAMHLRILYSNGNLEVYLTYTDSISGAEFDDQLIIDTFVGNIDGCDGGSVMQSGRVAILGGTGGAGIDADIDDLTITTISGGPGGGTNFRRGDTDGNGALEITDPINNLSFQFLGTFTPPCLDAADYDDNGKVEITDPIANLSHQFLGTAPPAPPGKDTCGPDPTPDDPGLEGADLGCLSPPTNC